MGFRLIHRIASSTIGGVREAMSSAIDVLLEALHRDCSDETAWLALAGALEESGQSDRAELTRLLRHRCAETEARVQELLQGGVPPCVPELVNSIGMRFVLIPPGTFRMGSPDDEEGRDADEGPVHAVEISRPFYLGAHPVTQAQWQAVMGANPSHFCATGGGKNSVKGLSTEDFPVEGVSWEEVAGFMDMRSALEKESEAGRKYRLPREAEWEYACRAGAASYQIFHLGNSLSSTQANFNGNYPYGGADKGLYLERTCKVGSYPANAFGLHDMHGNVWEGCNDWYAEDYYARSPRRDPPGPSEGAGRVIRGGSWRNGGQGCRSAFRRDDAPAARDRYLGFRLALVPAGR
jgi:uncharacterized protein (TIGR02996 family)